MSSWEPLGFSASLVQALLILFFFFLNASHIFDKFPSQAHKNSRTDEFATHHHHPLFKSDSAPHLCCKPWRQVSFPMCGRQNVFDVTCYDYATLQEQALVHSKELIKVYTCWKRQRVQSHFITWTPHSLLPNRVNKYQQQWPVIYKVFHEGVT